MITVHSEPFVSGDKLELWRNRKGGEMSALFSNEHVAAVIYAEQIGDQIARKLTDDLAGLGTQHSDLVLWHEAILRTRLANATLFGNMSSFLFVLYSFVALRALPRAMQGVALALAGLGAALLLGGSYELSPGHFTGDLLALGAAFFYALYLIAADRARRTMASWPVLAIATAAGTLPLLLFALAMGETVLPGDWTPLILLSLGSQLIGQGLLVYAMGHLSPAVVGVGLLTQPIASATIGWFAYGEALSLADGLGALLICAALVLIRLPARGVATPAAPAQ